MRHKIYYYLLLFFTLSVAGTVAGQTCPGPAVRTALINLQRANTTLTTNTTTGARAGQFGLTDTCGNQRYQYYTRVLDSVDCICCNPITTPVVGAPPSAFVKICNTDSIFYIDWKRDPIFLGEALTITQILDSLQNDTSFFNNWYTRNDTTTDILRTAYILRSAEWVGIDPTGFVRLIMGDVANSLLYADADEANIAHLDPSGQSIVKTNTSGVEILTSQNASRAVNIRTDTVNTAGSFDPTNFRLNFNSDNSYLYADSLKVVGLGQFPAFPTLANDGTDKGVFLSEGVLTFISGDGTTGAISKNEISYNHNYTDVIADATGLDYGQIRMTSTTTSTDYSVNVISSISPLGDANIALFGAAGLSVWGASFGARDTNLTTSVFLGESTSAPESIPYAGPRAFGVKTQDLSSWQYYWILSELPNDTTRQAISLYNKSYYFPNDRPSNVLNDTSVIVWIGDGTNAGKHPQFVPLPGGGSTVNWYNSNGTTTDNTRIADVLETATWRSDNVTFDGIVPFRFEIAGHHANEPENMVWAFPSGDSAVIRQADQEIVLFSNNNWLLYSDGQVNFQADSIGFSSNLSDGAWKTGRYGVVTQNTIHRDATETTISTGTGKTELFLDGFGGSAVWVVPASAATNFKIHLTAYCSSAGNGVGINTGDSFVGWYLGGIKRVGSSTSLIGAVQNAATAQSDAGMSTSTVTIDADDTDESLRIRFTPPSTAGTTTVISVKASIEIIN
jgi:hypothetical protein